MQCAAGCTGPKDSDCLVGNIRPVLVLFCFVFFFFRGPIRVLPLCRLVVTSMTVVCVRRTVLLPPSMTLPPFSPNQTLIGSSTSELPVWRCVPVRTIFRMIIFEEIYLTVCPGTYQRCWEQTCQCYSPGFTFVTLQDNSSALSSNSHTLVWWPFFKEGFDLFGWNVVSLCVDNYLAMDVACTLNYPKPNQEVVIPQPCGNDTQKCEKCEGDCTKGKNWKHWWTQRQPTDWLESEPHFCNFVHVFLNLMNVLCIKIWSKI